MNTTVFKDPDLHDGHLRGLMLLPASVARIYCTTLDGRDVTFTLKDLKHLRATNFLQGNIIFEVLLRDQDNFSLESLSTLFDGHSTSIERALLEARRQRWFMFEITSSYGCELVAICGEKVEAHVESS